MNKREFQDLKIGEIVVITIHGKNRGKQAIVEEIIRDNDLGGGRVYLRPINCRFEYSDLRTRDTNKDGLHRFSHIHIMYPTISEESANKHFYVSEMFGRDGVSWSADNFTLQELGVVERFLEEFNNKAGGLHIDGVAILDNDYQ